MNTGEFFGLVAVGALCQPDGFYAAAVDDFFEMRDNLLGVAENIDDRAAILRSASL